MEELYKTTDRRDYPKTKRNQERTVKTGMNDARVPGQVFKLSSAGCFRCSSVALLESLRCALLIRRLLALQGSF